MSTVSCPDAGRCKVTSHVLGSPAQRACSARQSSSRHCASGWTPPPPPLEGYAHRPRVLLALDVLAHEVQALPWTGRIGDGADMEEVLQSLDTTGWDPDAGQPHPTGGYLSREVFHGKRGVTVQHLDENDEPHRLDGPATFSLNSRGALDSLSWQSHGRYHRLDGPADTSFDMDIERPTVSFYRHGKEFSDVNEGAKRWWDQVAGGMGGAEATAWLIVQDVVDPKTFQALRAQGADPVRAAAAIEAGVVEPRALLAAATSRAPLSWAAPAS